MISPVFIFFSQGIRCPYGFRNHGRGYREPGIMDCFPFRNGRFGSQHNIIPGGIDNMEILKTYRQTYIQAEVQDFIYVVFGTAFQNHLSNGTKGDFLAVVCYGLMFQGNKPVTDGMGRCKAAAFKTPIRSEGYLPQQWLQQKA